VTTDLLDTHLHEVLRDLVARERPSGRVRRALLRACARDGAAGRSHDWVQPSAGRRVWSNPRPATIETCALGMSLIL